MDKVYFLSQLELFDKINRKKLSFIASKARLVEYKKNELVYKQGDPASDFYLIVFGQVKVFSKNQTTNKDKTHTYLHKGDFFGEISILTNQPHSVNVQAQNDCILLKISKADFEKVLKQVPELTLTISKSLGKTLNRKDSLTRQIQANSEILCLYAASETVDKSQIALDICRDIARKSDKELLLLTLSDTQSSETQQGDSPSISFLDLFTEEQPEEKTLKKHIHKHSKGIHTLSVNCPTEDNIHNNFFLLFFSSLCEMYDYIFVSIPNRLSELPSKTIEQADKIFLIVDDRTNILETSKGFLNTVHSLTGTEDNKNLKIVLLDEKDKSSGKSAITVKDFLKKKPDFRLCKKENTVVCEEIYRKNIQQISRNIQHTSIGLALGSGAALGLSHIGILKVLERNNIPIDMIAGCSIGSFLGSLWACGIKAKDLEKEALKLTRNKQMLSLFDLTLPTKGFFKGERIVKFLKKWIGEKTFDEIPNNIKIVASDLLSRERVVFETGPIYKAVRASISMPGVFEPVKENNRYLVDGGIIDPVPVSILQQSGATRIIAVNALPDTKRLNSNEQKIPDMANLNLVDILTRSIQTMEYALAESACREADITIRPLEHYHSYFEFLNAEELIKKGEEAAENSIKKIKELIEKT